MQKLVFILALALATAANAAEDAAKAFRIPSLYHVGYWVRDIAKSRAFYKDYLGYEEPYELRRPNGDLQLVVMKVNERQVIYLFTDATKILPNGDNLDHLGLETDNIEAVRMRLIAGGVKVGMVNRGRIGDFLLGMRDPDGHLTEMTQFAPEGQLLKNQGKALAPGRVSSRLLSATLTVADLTASRHFYEEVLGFKKIAAGGKGIAERPGASWVRLQVPDGTDYFDLLPYAQKSPADKARAVPEYALEVPDAARTFALLTARAKAGGFPPPEPVRAGRDGARETSVVDPDGTRVVLKEAARR